MMERSRSRLVSLGRGGEGRCRMDEEREPCTGLNSEETTEDIWRSLVVIITDQTTTTMYKNS